jgi:hypothetical protein
MTTINKILGKLVFKAFFKVIRPRRIEKHLRSQGYSITQAKEIISSFKKASLLSISQRD